MTIEPNDEKHLIIDTIDLLQENSDSDGETPDYNIVLNQSEFKMSKVLIL